MKRKTRQSLALGQVRIIGGDWRGRKLAVLNQDGLRPTGDRARETLFNWLQFELAGAVCLDAFAGSGALGFEALSRGAAHLVSVELCQAAACQLQHNARVLQCSDATIVQANVLDYLAQVPSACFDGVFIDPPFHQQLVQPVIDALLAQAWLMPNAWLYIEQERDAAMPNLPQDWFCYREKTTAQTYFSVWRRRQ
ncbi:MAG: 16S rRNA (guanine(966)-N(2))-methyltransferase RsmD [Thiomicrospira sp.]